MPPSEQDIPRPEWLDQNLFPFRHRQTHIDDHRIHYVDEGQGPTLLLLHGNGSWSFGFRYVIPSLSQKFRVVALDYPGFGLSTPHPGFSFKPVDQSKVVEKFVDALDLKDIRLFVEDWGGPIGLGLAGRRPELIHSLIISNTWAWEATGHPSLERFSHLAGSFVGHFLITRFNLLTRVALPRASVGRTLTAVEHKAYYMPYPTVASREPMAQFPREILSSAPYLKEVEDGLQKLKGKPVLIIWGEGDPGFGELERNKFKEHFKDASVLCLPNAKHFVLVDEPTRSVDAILEFERSEKGA